MKSVILTIHNKQHLIPDVIKGIFRNAVQPFEIICVLDGVTDNSENVLFRALSDHTNKKLKGFNVIETPDVYETKANNKGIKLAKGEYVIIIQDDCVIRDYRFDEKLTAPFRKWNDVFAVSGNCAHSWKLNDINGGVDGNGWSKLLSHYDHANKTNTQKGIFYIRETCNRGPLVINRADMVKLGYFDEIFSPLDSDDHDLMYRAKKELNKISGYVNIDVQSEPAWGGTRDSSGKTKQWVLDANRKNAAILYSRHKDVMGTDYKEERKLC